MLLGEVSELVDDEGAEQFSASIEPGTDRADWDAEGDRRFFSGQSFDVAEGNRKAEFFGNGLHDAPQVVADELPVDLLPEGLAGGLN